MSRMLSPREKLIAYISAAAIFLGTVNSFIIEPVVARNTMLNNEIKLARLKLKKYSMLLKKEEYIKNRYSKFNLNLPVSGRQEDRLVNVLSELEKIAQNSAIQIVDMRPQTSEGAGKYKEIMVDLKAEAAMEAYTKFIYDIENSQLILRVKKLQLNAKTNSSTLEGIFSISAVAD